MANTKLETNASAAAMKRLTQHLRSEVGIDLNDVGLTCYAVAQNKHCPQ